MATITPAKGQVLVRYLEEAPSVETPQQTVPSPMDARTPEYESELAQIEILSGTKTGSIGLICEWHLSQLVPGSTDMYFAPEESILGYSDVPLTQIDTSSEDVNAEA